MIARRLAAPVIVLMLAMGAAVDGKDPPRPALLEPRVVNAWIEGLWLDQAEVALQLAVRSGRDLTIRSVAFTDASVGNIPVWIAPVEGNWPLRPGQDVEIPTPIRVTAYARDALGSDDLANIVREGSVAVRATVEVAFATPWPARLLMQPSTQTAVTTIAIRVPVRTGPNLLQPFMRLGAAVVDRLQQEAAPFLMAGREALPANRDIVDRFNGAVATVTVSYEIDEGTASIRRSMRTAGLWWSPAILCTTREALEPWRFDVSDATTMQVGGGRLRMIDGYVLVETSGQREPLEISLSALERRLGKVEERSVYALSDGKPHRIRLADRDASSALTCVRVSDDTSNGPAALDDSPTAAAAFALGRSGGPVWTGVARDGDSLLHLGTPVHRHSFGSPLVTRTGIAGLVASPTRAWNSRALAAAAARAPRVELRAKERVEP